MSIDPKQHLDKRFGTAPVFLTAISTILGAILFLRFGYAVGTLGFIGVVLIIIVGHLVTIPTALAISELATNKRVEGGGEYFIISRSFGLNIGGTIGIALFLSQAISVAFYVIAFTEAFEYLFNWAATDLGWMLPRQVVSVPVMALLSLMILKKGANLGVKTLYVVATILAISLIMFFLGKPTENAIQDFSIGNLQIRNTKDFFVVFAIIFPAFTGMTAGVGLSGDLKNPARSIPIGTISATIIGMVIYFFVIWKLASSASPQEMIDHQLIMGKIALGGAFIIPIGLAASTISSAIGSIMVAPRTLQALAGDQTLPSKKVNDWLCSGRGIDNEPYNASLVTCVIALVFVALGNVNAVAQIISMFFMVTYGSLCLISFLNHFGSPPSYRPSFKSRWLFSLVGFVAAVYVMFKISTIFALLAILVMFIVYLYIDNYHRDRQGVSSIFMNAFYQLNRNLQVYLQQRHKKNTQQEWRPSALCISTDSFKRDAAFQTLNWISYKYGFGTYIHKIPGYFSNETNEKAHHSLEQLRERFDADLNHVFVDTLISPSYTSAIAQSIQIPGISGMENNLVLLEFAKYEPDGLDDIIDNFGLIDAGGFDIGIIASSTQSVYFKGGIHIWIRSTDYDNANLMILLSYIILAHPDWKKSNIKIFQVYREDQYESFRKTQEQLLQSGRLPITEHNIQWILEDSGVSFRSLVNEHSRNAGLTMIGFQIEQVKHEGEDVFKGYDGIGQILFIHSNKNLEIN
ncbi:MAG: amino acid permease [Bacteroidales bacterium]|nr:amino acid permease [Bacteroidales bacterium]